MAEPQTARLIIDLDALAANYAVLKAEAAGAELAPVVKADGYGLGAGPVAKRLWSAGARRFFVARLAEGEALRAALGHGRPAVIYILDGLTSGAGPRLATARLTPVLSSLAQVAAATAWAGGMDAPLAVALQVDTGMNRQGLPPHAVQALALSPDGLRGLDVQLVMSHLGSATEPADPRSAEQLARFRPIRDLFPASVASLSASAGIFLGADYRYDLVRPGVSLYGGGPEERPDPRLKAVATLTAPILDIRNLQPGDRIGYGSAARAERPMRLAIAGAGYADGVIRAGKGHGYAWFAGARRAIPSITMDMIAVEIADAAAAPGDHIELLGGHVHLDDVATAAGTVAHEVLVRLGGRAERIYLGAT